MDCPRCSRPTRVLESRRGDGSAVRRRRVCSGCGHRFTTFERAAEPQMQVRKRDGSLQRFDRTKLRAALLHSTHKRPVAADDVERLVDEIAIEVESAGGELAAEKIGALCLSGLERLDHGAYLQFLGTLPEGPLNPEIAESASASSVRAARESASLPAEAGPRTT
ncbi:MAG: ATP cone domain-containing protein [Solirubrobacterales bacterium]